MEYYKLNYDKLKNLKQINFIKFIILVILLIMIFIIISCFKSINNSFSFYGIYNNGIITTKINNELVDIFKSHQTLIFNKKEINYKIANFSEYEIIDNSVYQTINLTTDANLYQNEIGKIEIYDKVKLITYILELFKWGGSSESIR